MKNNRLTISECSEPVTELSIAKIESIFGCGLPKEFLDFYNRFNGGVPSCRYFKLPNNDDLEVQQFLPIDSSFPDIDEKYEYGTAAIYFADYKPLIPKHHFPFALATIESIIIIQLKGSQVGSIWVLDQMEWSGEFDVDDPPSKAAIKRIQVQSLKFVAPSFPDFISNFQANRTS